MFYTH
jgi:hypothetical protein